MNLLKSIVIVAAVALGSLLVPTQAQAATNKYGMVSIKNPTGMRINYYFRWGKDADWKSFSVDAGSTRWHSWEYDFANENRSPTPQIKFDEDLVGDATWRAYSLEAYRAPTQEIEYAKKYKFGKKGGGRMLDLYTIED